VTWIREIKTTSEDIGPGSYYWKKLTLDPQISIYIDAVRASIDPNVQGIQYDVLKKPAHRQSKTDKSPADLEKRCVEAICEEPDKYLQRGSIVRLADESLEAAADLWLTCDSIRYAALRGRWPRNPDSCVQFGRTCDYFAVCTGEADIRSELLYRPAEDRYAGVKHSLPLLSQSDIRTFRRCPRQYYFRKELAREPAFKAEPLRFGTAIHKALEAWWSSGGDLDKALSWLMVLESDPWGEAKARAMVRCYHARWIEDLKRWTDIRVEKEFVIPLVNPDTGCASRTFELCGRVDALAKERT
jgi:hypothetical protein